MICAQFSLLWKDPSSSRQLSSRLEGMSNSRERNNISSNREVMVVVVEVNIIVIGLVYMSLVLVVVVVVQRYVVTE